MWGHFILSIHKMKSIFGFELTAEEMHQIEELDTGKSLFFSHHNPEMVEWFMSFV